MPPLANPTVRRRVDRALFEAQHALDELTTYGGNRGDRELAIQLWDQIEKMRIRLQGGR